MRHGAIVLLLVLLGCKAPVEPLLARNGPPPGFEEGRGAGHGRGSRSGEGYVGEPRSRNEPAAVPTPTGPCPRLVDGVVKLCPAVLDTCRDVRVVNAAGASGSGPLALHWHGIHESPVQVLATDSAAQQLETMVRSQSGLMVLPHADPAAVARANNPFPWWVVCGSTPSQCDRLDDFILADEVVACAVEQRLVDPRRLTTSGASAGGIMASHLATRRSYFAGAVSWSGGLPPAYQPATPENGTAMMVIHGGGEDVYCGVGAADGCYALRPPSEALAADFRAAGNFSFLCDHQAGHITAMGSSAAQFLALARASGHPWASYPFGTDGEAGTGSNWMLNHYCYLPGQPSPWD